MLRKLYVMLLVAAPVCVMTPPPGPRPESKKHEAWYEPGLPDRSIHVSTTGWGPIAIGLDADLAVSSGLLLFYLGRFAPRDPSMADREPWTLYAPYEVFVEGRGVLSYIRSRPGGAREQVTLRGRLRRDARKGWVFDYQSRGRNGNPHAEPWPPPGSSPDRSPSARSRVDLGA